jgi:MFS family permease
MVWTAYTTSKGIWWAHRILIGLVVAPVESLPEVSVPDLFFAHERGNYMGFYTFVLFGSNALAPLLAGFITKHLEWKAAIWFGTIVVSVTTVIIFFGMEETIYFRSVVEGISDEAPDAVLKIGKVDEANATIQPAGTKEDVVTVESETLTEPPTYWQKLQLFRLLPNRPTVKQMGVMMYRPLQIFFLFPNVVWAGFLYGASLCLYQIGNATVGFVLGGPGYGWASDMVGLSYLAGKFTPVSWPLRRSSF